MSLESFLRNPLTIYVLALAALGVTYLIYKGSMLLQVITISGNRYAVAETVV